MSLTTCPRWGLPLSAAGGVVANRRLRKGCPHRPFGIAGSRRGSFTCQPKGGGQSGRTPSAAHTLGAECTPPPHPTRWRGATTVTGPLASPLVFAGRPGGRSQSSPDPWPKPQPSEASPSAVGSRQSCEILFSSFWSRSFSDCGGELGGAPGAPLHL